MADLLILVTLPPSYQTVLVQASLIQASLVQAGLDQTMSG